MRSQGVRGVGLVLLLGVIAACSGQAVPETTTTSPPTTAPPATTTTVSTTTTTTTTVPPGLAAQQLAFGFQPGWLIEYDATQALTLEMRTTSTPGGVFEGLTGEATFNHTLAGRMWQLVLAGPTEGTYEVIYDFRPSEGSTGGEVDNYSYTETLEGTDLDTAGGIVVPLVVDPAGNLSRSSGGAPWYWVLNAGPMDTMSLLGPPFPARPVDVGDTWSAGRIDRALGPMTFSAEIIEEVPRDGGYLFAVEFSGTAEDFPVELSLADAAQLFADAESQAATGSLLAMGEIPGAEITVEVVEVSLEGRYLLDPATGRVEEHESTARIVEPAPVSPPISAPDPPPDCRNTAFTIRQPRRNPRRLPIAELPRPGGDMATPADVLKLVKDGGFEFVDLRFCDLPGQVQHVTLPATRLNAESLEEGFGFDGSSIRGFQQIQESDMVLVPDPDTAVADPFRDRPL